MATITSSLKIMDQMTPVLKLVVNSLNQTLTAMGDLEKSMGKSFNPRSIDSARNSVKQLNSAVSELPASIQNSEKSQNRLNRSMRDGNGEAKQLLSTITGFVGAYVSIRSMVGLLSGGFEVFKTYESSMSRVKALSGATADEFKLLGDTAKQLGATTSFSAAQAADGMGFLAMAGYKTNDIVAAMPGLLSAAAAGQTELGQTADIVSNILSGFGLQASETGRVADVLTQAFTSSNTDLAMLGETMKYVAPNARAAGLALEETAAAAGILGNAGIQASMAGTSLRGIISRMSAPVGGASELMNKLGISVVNTDGTLKNLAGIIEQVSDATKNMGDAQRLAAVKTLVGEEAASGFLTLMAAGPDALRKFTSELENSTGRAEEIAAIMLDNTQGKLLLFKSKVEGAWIDFYENLGNNSDVANGFQNVLNGLYSALETLLPVLQQIIIYAGDVVNYFTENWSWIAPVISAIGAALLSLIVITQGAALAQAIFNAVLKANPVVLIVSLIIGLIAALINLWKTNDAFAAGFMRAWNVILNFFDTIPIFFTRVGYGIANAFDWARVQSLKIVEGLANGVIDTINWMIDKLNSIVPGLAMDTINHINIAASAEIEAEARKKARDADLASMKQTASEKAAEREQNVLKMLEDRAGKRALEQAEKGAKGGGGKSVNSNAVAGIGGAVDGVGIGKLPSIDKVGKVGKIEDKVDISSEDLKTMRELAEMKSIQNFVTFTPTVQVTTGPVHKEADVETIVARINETLQEEIAAGAAAVYT